MTDSSLDGRSNASARSRSVATIVAIVALLAAGVWLGRTGGLAPADLSARFGELGWWQVPAFVLAFAAWVLAALPGSVFVLAAPLLFGKIAGFALAYSGAVIAVTLPFLLARAGRGSAARPPALSRWRRLARVMERVEEHPVRSVFLLRLALFMSPPLNYALAFTGIRTRDYVLGSALGVGPMVAIVVSVARCLPWH
jgi:uncharacterized membrane protein YdjX (TVP38/TMEM64 family)